jgi:dynein heavy chain 1
MWMRTLQTQCQQWVSALPSQLTPLRRTPENIKAPLFRFFEREINIGLRLLRQVRADLTDVAGACAGTVKQTNVIRSLMTDLVKGVVPKSWRAYKVPDALTTNQWIVDFGLRIDQLVSLSRIASEGQDLQTARVWLGGLFVPEAFVTATRQAVAQAHGWSLEKLVMELDVRRDANDVPAADKRSFLLTGLRIDGATCAGDVMSLATVPSVTLPLTALKWSLAPETPRTDTVQLPVYLNATRANLVFMVSLRPGAGLTQDVFYKRGVALLCSALSGLVR